MDGSESVTAGRGFFEGFAADPEFVKGVADGKTDHDYALDPSNPKPYWQHLIKRLWVRPLP